ncbi:hypothetical protein COOONC_28032, partial [Cooperia oncophora]
MDAAESDFSAVLAVEPRNAEAAAKTELIADLRQYLHQAKSYIERKDCPSAEHYLNKAVEHLVWDPSLYRLRAKCLESRGEIRKAIADMRTLTKLLADGTEDYLRISQLYYEIDWMACLEKGQQILKTEAKVADIQLDTYRHLCKCNME